ncbi:type IV pilus modification protein PilV [Thalassotalea ganghwensis]
MVKNTISRQKGMTFIEVLVALFLIVTGILGAVAMQATAKKSSFDAMQRSLASALAQDIIEKMRSNDARALANYAGNDFGESLNPLPDRCNDVLDDCSAAQIATNDLYEWELALMGADVLNGVNNVGGLVGGRACIVVTNVNQVNVTVSWQGREVIADGGGNCGIAGGQRRTVILQAYVF